MKLLLLVVSTFIFVLQFHHSESSFSLFPNIFNITLNFDILNNGAIPQSEEHNSGEYSSEISDVVVNSFEKIKTSIKQREDESEENEISDDIVPQIQNETEYKRPDEDPIIHMTSMTTPQLIALHGYPAESHTIVTDDGYILTIHRIPYSKTSNNRVSPKKTVLLHHGLFENSAHWILAGPTKSLGYILSDAGYDVWLANVRGNTYSRAHISKNVDSREFWNFTFHEVSQHDLPAVIDYITDFKGSDVKINYIGYSMGTTILFALLSTKTQYNQVLRAGFALAPVVYMTNIKSPIKMLANYSGKIENLLKMFGGDKELLTQNPLLRWLSEHARELLSGDEDSVYENAILKLLGHDVQRFNKTLLPFSLSQDSAGTSTKTLIHYVQEIQQNGKFQMFDYGPAGNLKEYGTRSPTEYPLHKITLPIALFSAENDWLSSVVDVTRLQEQLVNPIEHYIVPLKEFNHGDFIWAIDAPTLVYARLLKLLENGVSKPNYSGNILDNGLHRVINKKISEVPPNLVNYTDEFFFFGDDE